MGVVREIMVDELLVRHVEPVGPAHALYQWRAQVDRLQLVDRRFKHCWAYEILREPCTPPDAWVVAHGDAADVDPAEVGVVDATSPSKRVKRLGPSARWRNECT